MREREALCGASATSCCPYGPRGGRWRRRRRRRPVERRRRRRRVERRREGGGTSGAAAAVGRAASGRIWGLAGCGQNGVVSAAAETATAAAAAADGGLARRRWPSMKGNKTRSTWAYRVFVHDPYSQARRRRTGEVGSRNAHARARGCGVGLMHAGPRSETWGAMPSAQVLYSDISRASAGEGGREGWTPLERWRPARSPTRCSRPPMPCLCWVRRRARGIQGIRGHHPTKPASLIIPM